MGSLLDNPIWYSALGPRRALAHALPGAARFAPDVAPFGALPDEADDAAWADLATLLGPGGVVVLFRPPTELPAGWSSPFTIPCLQMVADEVEARPDGRLVPLTPNDRDDMLELTGLAKPGPFAQRTVEFGGYLGYRANGRLVAMAGQRLHTGEHIEISAVCTHPDHRGTGLADAVTRAVLHGIRAEGCEGVLHVMTTNTSAIRLYERLGFRTRRELNGIAVQPPG